MSIIVYAIYMNTRIEKYAFMLALGLFFIFCGTTLLVMFLSPLETYSYLLLPTGVLVVGLVMLYLTLKGNKRAFFTFTGLFLCASWLLLLLVSAEIFDYSIYELWPIFVIISAIVLVPLGYIKYNFLPITLIVSAAVLAIVGITLLLFSLDIIKMSMTEFASQWWPLAIILFGFSLIMLFFYTQKHEREKWVKNFDDDED